MNHHVETTVVGDDFGDASSYRSVRGDVEFDRPEINFVLGGMA
jgi:hypothetical protein